MKKVKGILDKLNEPYFDDTNSPWTNSRSLLADILLGILVVVFLVVFSGVF